MTVQIIYDVPCPYCLAGVDKVCRIFHADGRSSSPRQVPHEARRTAFRIAKAAEPVRPTS